MDRVLQAIYDIQITDQTDNPAAFARLRASYPPEQSGLIRSTMLGTIMASIPALLDCKDCTTSFAKFTRTIRTLIHALTGTTSSARWYISRVYRCIRHKYGNDSEEIKIAQNTHKRKREVTKSVNIVKRQTKEWTILNADRLLEMNRRTFRRLDKIYASLVNTDYVSMMDLKKASGVSIHLVRQYMWLCNNKDS